MKKPRKRQQDRMLAHLSGYERRKQLRIRRQIQTDDFVLV
jgi:hypothetical protein